MNAPANIGSVLNIHQRLLKVMEAVDYIQKEKKTGMSYSIVSHDKVTAKVRPELVRQGVTYYPAKVTYAQDGNRTSCWMTVRFTNADNPEDCIDVESFGYGVDSQDKGPGKAMSYAVKYALLKALGLESGDDPDFDQTTDHVPEYLIRLDHFADAIQLATSLQDLIAAKERYSAELEKAGATHPANVNRLRQSWLRKKQELEALEAA